MDDKNKQREEDEIAARKKLRSDMEGLQELALKDEDTIRQINAIIRDRYFNRMKEIEKFYKAKPTKSASKTAKGCKRKAHSKRKTRYRKHKRKRKTRKTRKRTQ